MPDETGVKKIQKHKRNLDTDDPIIDESRSVQRYGDSLGSTLPADWFRFNRLNADDNLRVRAWEHAILITPGGD